MEMAEAMRAAWGYRPPRSFLEMHRARLFDVPNTPRNEWPAEIRRWTATGAPARVWLTVFELDAADRVAGGNAFVSESLAPGLVPIGGDGSGDAWCFDTRRKLHGTTPIVHVPHDGGGGVYVAPSFAGFVHRLLLENLQVLHVYLGWGLTRADLAATTLRGAEAASPWLLRRWRRDAERVARSGSWPDPRQLEAHLRKDPAFARLPRGEHDDVFR